MRMSDWSSDVCSSDLAGWTAGGWRFVAPVDGLCAWVETAGVPARFLSGAWHVGDVAATRIMIGGVQVVGAQGTAIAAPANGTTIDAECRAALAAVIAALRAHGLLAS